MANQKFTITTKSNVFSYTKYKRKLSRRDQNTIVINTTEGEGRGDVYAEKRWVSFIYFIADNKIVLLSMKLSTWCPYIFNSGRFPRLARLFPCRISIALNWLYDSRNGDIQIKKGEYLQYLDHKDICINLHQ